MSPLRSVVAVFVIALCFSSPASATADFFCVAKTVRGILEFDANVSSEGAGFNVLLAPYGNPSLLVDGKGVTLTGTSLSTTRDWTRIVGSRGLIFSFRRTGKKFVLETGMDYRFCNERNSMDFCWSADIRYRDGDGRIRKVQGVCGAG